MKLFPIFPGAILGAIGAIETGFGALQIATQGEPTLGMQWLNSGLIIAIGGALIAAFVRFKDKTMEQQARDREASVRAVQEAKDEVEKLMEEGRRDAAKERAAMHADNRELLEGMAKSVDQMGFVLFGVKGTRGIPEEMAYSGEVRHAMIEHIQAIEGYLYVVSKMLAKHIDGLPEWIAPQPIRRRRQGEG